ncbi:exosome complex component RRP42 isoform X2 [Oryzias latipes]
MATVKVSEAEKVYILHGIRDDLRVDGRSCEDYRHMEVETDVVSNTDGSARVSLGHTAVLVGIKAEIGKPRPLVPDEGYLEFFVDCSANATPEFEGRGGEELGIELSNTLYRVFNNKNSIDLKGLCISAGEHCWVLYVDVLLLQCDGNLYDAISVAIKAALFNTKIPRVHMSSDDEGGKEVELSDDPFDCVRLSVENVPCIVTLCGPQTRSGRDSAGEGVLGGEPHHRRHAQGHGDLRQKGGRREPGSREHLRNDRGGQTSRESSSRSTHEAAAAGRESGKEERKSWLSWLK